MALRRVFVEWIRDGSAGVAGPRAHHLARVARLRAGETVEITDHERLFLAQVKSTAEQQVVFDIVEKLPVPARPFPIVLQAAIFKFPRLEWAIEKSAELGVESIVPVAAHWSERGLVQSAAKRLGRWQKIAEEAAQQSRRLAPPSVAEPVSFEAALAASRGPLRVFLDSDAPPLRDILAAAPAVDSNPAYLLVGPEGGWTDREREQAREAGYQPAGLGTGILRAETAAVAALALAAHLLPERPSD